MVKPVKSTNSGKTLDDFRKMHDKSYIVPLKIRTALVALGDGWEYEIEFLKLAGVSNTDLAAHREPFEDDHVVMISIGGKQKRAWAGTRKIADQMREMVS